jgi:hypothetical protein
MVCHEAKGALPTFGDVDHAWKALVKSYGHCRFHSAGKGIKPLSFAAGQAASFQAQKLRYVP